MNDRAVPTAPAGGPVFVLGERAAAMQLVQALGDTPTLCAMPAIRLLGDLVSAADRCTALLESRNDLTAEGLRPANWYGDVQAAHLRATGKRRTVEFSGLSILRLCTLFPSAQFLVVRQLKRPLPRSGRMPGLADDQILEVDSGEAATLDTIERALAFLGEIGAPVEVDLSDQSALSR